MVFPQAHLVLALLLAGPRVRGLLLRAGLAYFFEGRVALLLLFVLLALDQDHLLSLLFII
jgi:hypothetical protein